MNIWVSQGCSLFWFLFFFNEPSNYTELSRPHSNLNQLRPAGILPTSRQLSTAGGWGAWRALQRLGGPEACWIPSRDTVLRGTTGDPIFLFKCSKGVWQKTPPPTNQPTNRVVRVALPHTGAEGLPLHKNIKETSFTKWGLKTSWGHTLGQQEWQVPQPSANMRKSQSQKTRNSSSRLQWGLNMGGLDLLRETWYCQQKKAWTPCSWVPAHYACDCLRDSKKPIWSRGAWASSDWSSCMSSSQGQESILGARLGAFGSWGG